MFYMFSITIHQPKLKRNDEYIVRAKNLKKIILEFAKENNLEMICSYRIN